MRSTAVQPTFGPLAHAVQGRGEVRTTAELVAAAGAGDALAWRQLVGRYDGLVHATARRFRLNDADTADVAQTTWLRLVENIGRIQDAERLEGWLATTASREALRVLSRRDRERPSDADYFEAVVDRTANDPEASVLDGEMQTAVRDAVDTLPAPRRVLLWTLAVSGRPCYTDVAVHTGMPRGSIGPTRQRALRQVRQHLVTQGFATA